MAIFRKHFIVKSFETSKVTKRKGNDSHINSASQYIIKKQKLNYMKFTSTNSPAKPEKKSPTSKQFK